MLILFHLKCNSRAINKLCCGAFVVLIHYSLSVDEMWFPSPQQTQTAVNRSAQSSCQTLRWTPRFWGEGRRGDQSRHAAHLELFKNVRITRWASKATVDCNHNTALSKLLPLLLIQGTVHDHRTLQTDGRYSAKSCGHISCIWKQANSDWLFSMFTGCCWFKQLWSGTLCKCILQDRLIFFFEGGGSSCLFEVSKLEPNSQGMYCFLTGLGDDCVVWKITKMTTVGSFCSQPIVHNL